MDWPRAPSGSTCLGDGTVCGCVDALQFEQNTIRSVHRFCITPLQKLAYDRHPSSCHHSSVSCSTTERAGRCWRPPSGRRGALRLGRPYESPAQGSLTRSRSSPSPGQCLPFPRRYPPLQSCHRHLSLPLRLPGLFFGCVSDLFAEAITCYAPGNASRRRLKTSPLASLLRHCI